MKGGKVQFVNILEITKKNLIKIDMFLGLLAPPTQKYKKTSCKMYSIGRILFGFIKTGI